MIEKVKAHTLDVLLDDDVNIIVEALKKAEENKVVINIPEGNDLLMSQVGLQLLKKTAAKLEKQIVVVTPTASSREFVASQGILSAENAGKAELLLTEDESKDIEAPSSTRVKKVETKGKSAFSMTIDDSGEPPLADPASLQIGDDNNWRDKPILPQTESDKSGFVNYDFAQGRPTPTNGAPSPVFNGGFGGAANSAKSGFGAVVQAVTQPLGRVLSPIKGTPLKILAVLLFICLIGFVAYYRIFPKLRITLTLAAEAVALEKVDVTAVSSLTGFDTDKQQIQLLEENVTTTGSNNITASGTEFTGNKATGVVTMYNTNNDPVTVPANTKLTSNNLSFVTNQQVQVPPKIGEEEGTASVGITAAEIGTEYNLGVNTTFAVANILGVSAQNEAPLTGGTKEQKTVLDPEKDVKKAVESLEEELYEQTKNELQSLHTADGFVFIDKSVKNKLSEDPEVDPPIGTPTKEAFLEVKVESTALYYHEPSLEKLLEELLKNKYRDNHKDDEEGITEVEIDSFEYSISEVVVNSNGNVTISVAASGRVVPQLNKVDLEEEIRDNGWKEMEKRLNSIESLESKPRIVFFPQWIPSFLRYVPKEDSRVEINVRVVE